VWLPDWYIEDAQAAMQLPAWQRLLRARASTSTAASGPQRTTATLTTRRRAITMRALCRLMRFLWLATHLTTAGCRQQT
jgi:hypothetical protein